MAQIETKFNMGDVVFVIGEQWVEQPACPTCGNPGYDPGYPRKWVVLGSFVVEELSIDIDIEGCEIFYSTAGGGDPCQGWECYCFSEEMQAKAECDKLNKEK